MSSFTCITCRVAFKDGETQRLHYKSDWHRYNLKRKVAELPPVTAEEFQRRVLIQRSTDQEQQSEKSVHCTACRKTFSNDNAFENHLNSKKHKDNEKHMNSSLDAEGSQIKVPARSKQSISTSNEDDDMSVDSEIEEVDSDEWDDDDDVVNPVDVNNCLFCSHHSRTLVKNIKHMTVAHSFFIPDTEYCIDMRGLLVYLGEKITKGYMCLWCNEKGRSFYSADAARQHMVDKGHCKMIHEGIALAEYADYYDYSTSYPDAETTSVDVDDEVEVPEIDDGDYQLVLPSGAVVGHRSLMRYYKQSIDPNRSLVVSRNSRKLHKVLAHYKALGWSATQQEAAARKARDIHYMKRMKSKLETKLSVKANKMQKYFRPQVNY